MDLATKRMQHPISATWHAVLATKDELKEPRTSAALFVENKFDPVYDYDRYVNNSGEKSVVETQFPNQGRFHVQSLVHLMVEKWKSENNPKGNEPAEDIINRYMNFPKTVANVIANNDKLSNSPNN